MPYITFPQTGVSGLTYTNPNPQGLEILFEPPISPFLDIHPDGGAVSSALKNQLDVTTKNVNFNFAVVTRNNSRQEFSEQFRVEPYAVPSIPEDFTVNFDDFGSGTIRLQYNFPSGIDRNYILAITIGISPQTSSGIIATNIGLFDLLSISLNYTSFGIRSFIPDAFLGTLDFYDENLKIVRPSRAMISTVNNFMDENILYTAVQETQTSEQFHLHTFYIGFDTEADNNTKLRSIEIFSNVLNTRLNVTTFISGVSIYNRMRHGDFANPLFPYYPILGTTIPAASDSPLGINDLPGVSTVSETLNA